MDNHIILISRGSFVYWPFQLELALPGEYSSIIRSWVSDSRSCVENLPSSVTATTLSSSRHANIGSTHVVLPLSLGPTNIIFLALNGILPVRRSWYIICRNNFLSASFGKLFSILNAYLKVIKKYGTITLRAFRNAVTLSKEIAKFLTVWVLEQSQDDKDKRKISSAWLSQTDLAVLRCVGIPFSQCWGTNHSWPVQKKQTLIEVWITWG